MRRRPSGFPAKRQAQLIYQFRPVGIFELFFFQEGCLSRRITDRHFKYEGTPHFPVTASSAKIGFWKVNLKPLKGEVP